MKRLAVTLMVLLSMTVTAAFAASPVVLKAGHSANTNEPYQIGLEAFAKAVEEKSNGRIKVEIYPNCVLGSESEMIDSLLLGNLDFTVPTNGLLTNYAPILSVFDLPFLFDTREALYKNVDGPVGDVLAAALQKKGFRLLAFYEAGVRHIMTVKKPVNSFDDLKGLKIRVMEIPAHIDSFNQFGAKGTPLAYSELYSALQSGVVDGAEAANTNYYSKQFYRVAPYWAEIGWTTLVADLVMSEEKFQSFSKEDQQILLDAARESAAVERKFYADSDAKLAEELAGLGAIITRPDPAPFRKASEKVYAKFIKTDEMKELVRMIRENQ